MFFQNKSEVCIALTDRSLRYLVFNSQNKEIIEYDEVVFDTFIIEEGHLVNTTILRSTLEYLVKEKKWKKKKLHFIVPDYFVTMKKETIPSLLNAKEAKEYINLQLGNKIRLPFKNPRFDFEILKKDEEVQTLLLIAYPNEQLEPIRELFEEVGLVPVVADVSSLSIYRTYKELASQNTSEEKHLLLVQWQKFDIGITVFHEDYPQFNRHTQLPEMSDLWSYNEQSEWDFTGSSNDLDMLVREQLTSIERFLEFYRYSVMNGEATVTDIVVLGDFSSLDNIREQMNTQYGVKVNRIPLPNELPDQFASLYGLINKEKQTIERKNRDSKKNKASQKLSTKTKSRKEE